MLPVIEDVFVRHKKLLSEDDMLDMIAITQTLPGMIAVNAAIFVGHKTAGWIGAFAAVLGVILPSVVIITILAMILISMDISDPHLLKAFSCVRACVTAIFCMMAYRIGKKVLHSGTDWFCVSVFLLFLMIGISPIYVILSSIPVGWFLVLNQRFREKVDE